MNMNTKQKIAIIAPLALIGFMYPVFRLLMAVFDETIAWYLGLITYWLIWGAIFPLLIIGWESIKTMIFPKRINAKIILLVMFPVAMASLYRIIPGMGYTKPSIWILLLYLSTTLGNGIFEEIMWRGVYLKLFPENVMFRVIWPTFFFALWHYIPGSVNSDGNVIALMIGAGIFGFYLSFLVKKTDTIWWSIITHILGGLVMIS